MRFFTLEWDGRRIFRIREELKHGEDWKVYVDGVANIAGCGLGVHLVAPKGALINHAIKVQFQASNNEGEYEAVLAGLSLAKTLGVRSLTTFTYSKLISNQINSLSMTRNDRMVAYKARVVQYMKEFDKVAIVNILREENSVAICFSNGSF